PEGRTPYRGGGPWRPLLTGPRPAPAGPAPAGEVPALVEALMARGVGAKVAAELVASHPPGRIQTKLEVFDWLVRNQDKRVGKNPAGYLVSSIRSDYQAPGDFTPPDVAARAADARRAADEADRRRKQHDRDEAERAQARESDLRARWERLSEADRDAILAKVKADNPGLGRWKKMLEPLCLAELERRLGPSPAPPPQGTLF